MRPALGHPTTKNSIPSPPKNNSPRSSPSRLGRTASVRLVRLITSHAFVDSYTVRFHPRKATHCPECGVNLQTVAHVIQRCPGFEHSWTLHLRPVAHEPSVRIGSPHLQQQDSLFKNKKKRKPNVGYYCAAPIREKYSIVCFHLQIIIATQFQNLQSFPRQSPSEAGVRAHTSCLHSSTTTAQDRQGQMGEN